MEPPAAPAERPSIAGSLPVLVSLLTTVVYVGFAAEGGIDGSPRRLFVAAWLAGTTIVGAFAVASRSPAGRAVAGSVASAAMLAAGSASLMTIGLPLALAGVVEAFYVFSVAEVAAARAWRGWLGLAAAGAATLVAFAIGVAATPA